MGNCILNQQIMVQRTTSNLVNKKVVHFSTDMVQNFTQSIDNPHHLQLNSKFLQTNIQASNHLLQQIPLKTVKMVKFPSICSDIAVDDNNMTKNSEITGGKIKRHPSMKINIGDFISTSKKKIQNYYIIHKKVGAGTFGEVFLAQNIVTGDLKAIKAIRKNLYHKHVQQIQILKSCDHPNIIQIYQVFQEKMFCYVVMEYCPGGSIVQLIKQQKYLYHEDQARVIMQQILHALIYLHEKGIVHRDIKLQNVVFMTPNSGKNYTSNLKIIDFGNAQRIKYKVNKVSKLGGTTIYMPPQAFSGWFTNTFDIWSCGVLLFILLSASCPFKGKTKEETITQIQNKQITFTQPTWSKISEQAKNLITLLLNKDFLRRPSALQCLDHVWFQPQIKRSLIRKASQKLTKNLSKYYAINNFVSIIQSYLSFLKMSQSQKNQIKQIFQALDTNHKGFLSINDIQQGAKLIQYKIDQQILSDLFEAVDKNKSGFIDYSQFQAAMSNRQKLFIQQSLKNAFDHFDTDGSGYIQRKQLLCCLNDNSFQAEQLLKQIDKDQDQKISKNEFIKYFQLVQKNCKNFNEQKPDWQQ